MTATAIQQSLGEHAPSLPTIIAHLTHDDRFSMNEQKRWRLATEEEADEPEEADLPEEVVEEQSDPKKKDDGLTQEQW